MKKINPMTIGVIGGAVGLGLGVANMIGLIGSDEQMALLAVGQFALGIGLVSVASALSKSGGKE